MPAVLYNLTTIEALVSKKAVSTVGNNKYLSIFSFVASFFNSTPSCVLNSLKGDKSPSNDGS
jgi:hypothetical protein